LEGYGASNSSTQTKAKLLDEKAKLPEIAFFEQEGSFTLEWSLEDLLRVKSIKDPVYLYDRNLRSLLVMNKGDYLEYAFETFIESEEELNGLDYRDLEDFLAEINGD
jgi:hypothetical protein